MSKRKKGKATKLELSYIWCSVRNREWLGRLKGNKRRRKKAEKKFEELRNENKDVNEFYFKIEKIKIGILNDALNGNIPFPNL